MPTNLDNRVMGLDGKMYEQVSSNSEEVLNILKTPTNNIKTGTIMDGIENDVKLTEENTVTMEEMNKTVKLDEQTIQRLMAYQNHKPSIREYKKIGRNDPCPCGSNKKYKNCCLQSNKYEQLTKKK